MMTSTGSSDKCTTASRVDSAVAALTESDRPACAIHRSRRTLSLDTNSARTIEIGETALTVPYLLGRTRVRFATWERPASHFAWDCKETLTCALSATGSPSAR